MTYLPLATIETRPINDKFRSFAKGSRLAVDVIQYDPAIERAIQFAFGSSLVCDNMEIARYICFQKDQEVKGRDHHHDHFVIADVENELGSCDLKWTCHS